MNDDDCGFVTDALLEEEDICNFKREIAQLDHLVEHKGRAILYAPRNYGKTSIIKNVTARHFAKRHKQGLIFFADFMEVKSMADIELRLTRSFEKAYNRHFPLKSILSALKAFVSGLRYDVELDPMTGLPSVQLQPGPQRKATVTIQDIFDSLQRIAQTRPVLLIFDEFQDIHSIASAQSLFRQGFQTLSKTPIIVSGSKRHLLAEIFAKPAAPLAAWGVDIELKPIDYEVYHRYIQDRLKRARIKLPLAVSQQLQDAMQRIPEAINMLCQQLLRDCSGKTLDSDMTAQALINLIEQRASRYEAVCAGLTENEVGLLAQLARQDYVSQPLAKSFLRTVKISAGGVSQLVKKLMNMGMIEKESQGYRLSDPLFKHFLTRFR